MTVIGWSLPEEKGAIFDTICSSVLDSSPSAASPNYGNRGNPLEALGTLLMSDNQACLGATAQVVHMMVTDLPLELARRVQAANSGVVPDMVSLLIDGSSYQVCPSASMRLPCTPTLSPSS